MEEDNDPGVSVFKGTVKMPLMDSGDPHIQVDSGPFPTSTVQQVPLKKEGPQVVGEGHELGEMLRSEISNLREQVHAVREIVTSMYRAMMDMSAGAEHRMVGAVEVRTHGQDTSGERSADSSLSVASLVSQVEALQAMADARLKVIEEQQTALEAFRKARIKERLREFLRPRIGVLYHYPPRPLQLPKPAATLPPNPPLVSIVTPSYGQARFIERTLRSVLDQNYPRLEYIVQDGGSTDGTVEILERYSSALKHWESSKDNGQAHALNLGFRHATGEIMGYLNSDDLLLPGALHYVAQYFTKNPRVDVVYGHRVLIEEYDREVGRWVLPPHENEVLSWADYIPQETLFWRRRIWEKIGGSIDESFRFAMDWDLILRFRDAGAKFVRLPRFLGAFRVHAHQKTSAEISKIGAAEMERLRTRCHGRAVDYREINRGKMRYMVMHLLYDKAYRALRLA